MPAARHARVSRRPPLRRTLTEAIALITPAPTVPMNTLLAGAARGDGHAVLALPGWLCGDGYTAIVRAYLNALGYSAHAWDLGANIGPTKRLLQGAIDRLIELSDQHGPVSILGFSMGGLFARWLSFQMPARVRQIITVCSPIHEPARNFCLPLDPLLGMWPNVDLPKLAHEIGRPVPVPGTYLYSDEDGVVTWTACCDTSASPEDNIEIGGPHMLIAQNPKMMAVLAERLARQPGAARRDDDLTWHATGVCRGAVVDGRWHDRGLDLKTAEGRFIRPETQFRNWVTPDGSPGVTGQGGFKAETGRYHLWRFARFLGTPHPYLPVVEGAHGENYPFGGALAHGRRWLDAPGWPWRGARSDPRRSLPLRGLQASADYTGWVTVPILWDKQTGTIVSNESAEIIRMLNSAFDDVGAKAGDYYPQTLRPKIDEINSRSTTG